MCIRDRVHDPDEVLCETDDFKEKAQKVLDWADLLVLGPGLGQGEYVSHLVEFVLSHA